jgi:hypothetical protein
VPKSKFSFQPLFWSSISVNNEGGTLEVKSKALKNKGIGCTFVFFVISHLILVL